MIDDHKWTTAASLGALVLTAALASGTAHAQILTRSASGPVCEPIADFGCTTDASCDTGQVCSRFGDSYFCTPNNAIFCCSEASDCPVARPGEDATTCTGISGISGAGGLCLPDRDYCGATHVEDIIACHTSPMGALVRVWGAGDCDGDGVVNGVESEIGTDPCRMPAPVASFDGGTCTPLDTGCVPGRSCLSNGGAGTCITTGDGAGTFCAPPDVALYCCGSTVCPEEGDACVPLDGVSVCVDSLCAERVSDLVACVTADGQPVSFEEGDCDSDGATNGEEMEAGTDPCGVGGSIDAGTADGGTTEEDAGGGEMRADGGEAPGPTLDVRFQGGGGCACRAAPARSTGAPLLSLLGVAIALALTRRR